MKAALGLLILGLASAPVFAQNHAHSADAKSPYSAMAERQIKALSIEQISDLRAGRGMSLALPAELNGYPGPSHTLELAEALELTTVQRGQVQGLFVEMKKEAMPLGVRLIESERELDSLFAARTVTPAKVTKATAKAAALQGELRAVHLKDHLTMRDVLSAAQITRYGELRGYNPSAVHPLFSR